MYNVCDCQKENIPPPSVAIAHTLDEAGAAKSRFMPSLSPLQIRNEWLVRAFPRSIKAIKLVRTASRKREDCNFTSSGLMLDVS